MTNTASNIEGIRMECGDLWRGTFQILLVTLADDLLSEGPADVQVTFDALDGVETVEGEFVSLTAGRDKMIVETTAGERHVDLDAINVVDVQ